MMLRDGSVGPEVERLQARLEEVGFSPGRADGDFGPATRAAVIGFQMSCGLLADGIAGPRTLAALGLADADALPSVVGGVTVTVVSRIFPVTPVGNIRAHLAPVCDALVEAELTDRSMVLMALATIRAETEGFEPIDERPSKFNTSPNGHPFDLYDHRRDLGNRGPPDGARYRGRGFIQLTGRDNYRRHGEAIGLGDGLLEVPESANDPVVAARLMVSFLKAKERAIKEALMIGDLRRARRLVNGGSHGLDRFADAFRIGDGLID